MKKTGSFDIDSTSQKGSMIKKSLPGILVSLIIIGVLLYFVDFDELLTSFRNVSAILLVEIFLLQTIAFVFRSLAWRVILDGEPSLAQGFWTITEGYLLNLLPLRLGELGRAVIMGGIVRRSPFYVFSTVLLERLFDVIITLIMLISTVPLLSGSSFSVSTYYILFAVILIGLVVVFLITRNQASFLKLLSRILKPDSKIGLFVLPKIQSLLGGMEILSNPRKFYKWLFWIFMTWCCWWLTLIIGMRFFFPQLPIWASFFTQSIGALGGAIPSAPAGLGVVEGAYVFALSLFNINQSRALAFGLLMHAIGILTPMIWGIIGFSIQGQKFSEVFKGLQNTDLSEKGN